MFIFIFAMISPALLAQESGTSFTVDTANSWLRVLAYPDGPLRRFGHHHVISHHGISGDVEVGADPLSTQFSLEISVTDLVVDDPELRALEGEDFEKEVPDDDREGTRANMLGERLLHGDEFPLIQVQSGTIAGQLPNVNIETIFVVKGLEFTVTIPSTIELADDSFVAKGQFEITHDQLGLSQFTAAGGAMSVRDLLVFKYEISGTRQ